MRDCPRNPDKQEAARRVVNPQPQLIAASQKRAAFTPLPAPAGGGGGGESSSSSGGGNLVQLLAGCLERQQLPASQCYQAGLCGAVQHFGSTLFSSGWGCGYNNIQALASHLLAVRPVSQRWLQLGCLVTCVVPASGSRGCGGRCLPQLAGWLARCMSRFAYCGSSVAVVLAAEPC